MRISGLTSLLALSTAVVAATISVSIVSRAFAADDCPTEKRKVCVEETIAGHTFKHPAMTNECLAKKFGGTIVNEGDCPH